MRRLTIIRTTILALCIVHGASCIVVGQQKYWISFSDKHGTSFNPHEYFDQRTIEQRQRWNIPLADSTDFPVNQQYLEEVTALVSEASHSSRWLNGMVVFATEKQIEKVKHLPFVREVESMETSTPILLAKKSRGEASYPRFADLEKEKQELLKFQTRRMQGEKLREKNLDGSGIRIAMFDAGFPAADKHPALEHLFQNRRIIATRDFIKNRDHVFSSNSHGTATLSCVAGKVDSINIGMATGAEFLLARTERSFGEGYGEEENWLAAAEWADKNGANMISSSLGYGLQRYFNTEMNGRESLVARAATVAASKGILVVNSAGNEGTYDWRFVITPADADSVLAVGGTNPYTDCHIFFSSFGPTSDGRVKPNVCALGEMIVATPKGYSEMQGTSFAAPMVTGFAACVWQQHRDWNNMKLFHEIEKSGHLYPYFDYAHGYGIPQADYFTGRQKDTTPTFYFVLLNNNLTVSIDEKYAYADMERLLGYKPVRNLYYRIEGKDGKMKAYSVVLAEQKEVLSFSTDRFKSGEKLTVHFEGYTNSYTITGEENPPSPVDQNK